MIKEFPNVIQFPTDNRRETTENEGVIIPFRTSQRGEVGSSIYRAYETSLLDRRGLDREMGALTRWLTNNADKNFNNLRPTLDSHIDFLNSYADENNLLLQPLEDNLLILPVDEGVSQTAPEIYNADIVELPLEKSYPPLHLVEEPVE